MIKIKKRYIFLIMLMTWGGFIVSKNVFWGYTDLSKEEKVQIFEITKQIEGMKTETIFQTLWYLLKGGDPNLADGQGKHLLDYAYFGGMKGNFVKPRILILFGADVHLIKFNTLRSLAAYDPSELTYLIKKGGNVIGKAKSGETLLYDACSTSGANFETIKLLVEKGVDVCAKTWRGTIASKKCAYYLKNHIKNKGVPIKESPIIAYLENLERTRCGS